MTLLSTLLLGAILCGPVWKDLEILTRFSFPGPFMMLGSTQIEASNSRLPCCLSQARSGLRSHLLSLLISELEIDQREGLNHEWLEAFQSCRNYKINTNKKRVGVLGSGPRDLPALPGLSFLVHLPLVTGPSLGSKDNKEGDRFRPWQYEKSVTARTLSLPPQGLLISKQVCFKQQQDNFLFWSNSRFTEKLQIRLIVSIYPDPGSLNVNVLHYHSMSVKAQKPILVHYHSLNSRFYLGDTSFSTNILLLF